MKKEQAGRTVSDLATNQMKRLRKLFAYPVLAFLAFACRTNDEVTKADIHSLNCSTALVNKQLLSGQKIDSALVTISYVGQNSGFYESQNVESRGIKGLNAFLPSGNISSGSGELKFLISGVPPRNGGASFLLSVGGKSCVFSLRVDAQKGRKDSCVGESLFNPDVAYGSVSDVDGNTYRTTQIGSQRWMSQNLRVGRYRNGDPIPNLIDSASWAGNATGAFCWSENDSAKYHLSVGKLYNWYAVSDPRGLCPAGWHVPTDLEWQTLERHLGMPESELNVDDEWVSRGKDQNVGGMLKSACYRWMEFDEPGTDETGFAGIPGGFRVSNGFLNVRSRGYFWSGSPNRCFRELYSGTNGIYRHPSASPVLGINVRCVQD